MCNLLAVDGTHDPDIAGINGASAALALSDIPWDGPIGAVRVGLIDDQLIVNPTRKERLASPLNLVIAAAERNHVIMIDASGNNVLQQDFMKAVKFGVKEAQKIIAEIKNLQILAGKPKRLEFAASGPTKVMQAEEGMGTEVLIAPTSAKQVREKCVEIAREKLEKIFTDATHDKISRDVAVNEVRGATVEALRKEFVNFEPAKVSDLFNEVSKETFRNLVFDTNKRWVAAVV